MAAIHDLLSQVQDEALRTRLEQEINRLSKTKKFGLVFEEHLPECTPLYDIPVKRGTTVAKKNGIVSEMYEVNSIKDGVAICYHKVTEEKEEIPVDALVCVAQFGEPIYPYLKPIDSVCNASDSDLWHTLIEADNYHALQLLEYLYAGKVDCIYIDPPYNTGAKDWKYNNDYVDSSDAYRHSKWLSFMEKRLKIAKKLLNLKDSVLIVTIDEKEYLHLGCLLEEMFPDARIQMISTIINPTGNNHANEFSRTNEYIFVVMFGICAIEKVMATKTVPKDAEVHWEPLKRSDLASRRGATKGGTMQFYPIYVNIEHGKIVHIGDPLSPEESIDDVPHIEGAIPVFPIRDNGTEMNWGLIGEELKNRLDKGFVRVGKYTPKKPQKFVLSYLTTGAILDIENGKAVVKDHAKDGSVIAYYVEDKKSFPTTQWSISTHDAKNFGTGIIRSIMPDRNFSFPKSLYAVQDVLNIFVGNKKNALIVDFFSGSGTTLHAVNLMNANDSGKRRCIMVTNNEVSENEAKVLRERGFQPGDREWEELGIARFITWPRTVCSIYGKDTMGEPLKGNYVGSDIPMADGFRSNAAYFKLGFLDKTSVALGRQLSELFPILWLKAGAHGPCPQLENEKASMMVLENNRFAILMDEKHFQEFNEEVQKHPKIQTIYIVTDSEAGYCEMVSGYVGKDTFQLYRDYLDNFRINTGR